MIFDHQQRYLDTLPDDGRLAHIFPFDPKAQTVAKEMMENIEKVLPGAKIYYQGSSALGIAGENDIDLSINFPDFNKAVEELGHLFGPAKHISQDSTYAHWDFVRDGFLVDMGLQPEMTPMLKEQLKTQLVLEKSEDLRKEYEQIKLESDGLPWKEYLIKKYEFWNRITSI